MTGRSRRQARSVTGTPRCTVSSSSVVTRCSPRTSCPPTPAKAWCQSVGSLVMYWPLSLRPPVLMELYHTGQKFGGGPRNEAHVPKFLPRPVSPGLFQSWELAASRWSAVHSQLAGAERAPTCSILGPPQCDARSRLPSGWWGAAHAQKQRSSSRLSLRRRRRPQAEAKKLATSGYAGNAVVSCRRRHAGDPHHLAGRIGVRLLSR